MAAAVAPSGRQRCLLADATYGRRYGAVEMAGEWCRVPEEQKRSRGDRTEGCSQKQMMCRWGVCWGWPDVVAGEGWRRPSGWLLDAGDLGRESYAEERENRGERKKRAELEEGSMPQICISKPNYSTALLSSLPKAQFDTAPPIHFP